MSEGIAQGWVASATCGDGEIEGPGLGEAGILISGVSCVEAALI